MVRFNEGKIGSFTVTIEGQQDNYIETIKSLLYIISVTTDRDFLSQKELYDVCRLISDMLPDPNQIINPEDAALLKELKKQRYESKSK